MAGGLYKPPARVGSPEMKGTARRLGVKLSPIGSRHGTLLFGISTAFVFAVIQRIERI